MQIITGGILSAVLLASIPFTTKQEVEFIKPTPEISQYEIELDDWVERLAKCESGNNPKAINPDDGGSRSVGYVQFKDATWAGYIKKFNLHFTPDDIWDKEAQKYVTKEIIRKDYRWQNWYNCVTKHGVGLPPKSSN